MSPRNPAINGKLRIHYWALFRGLFYSLAQLALASLDALSGRGHPQREAEGAGVTSLLKVGAGSSTRHTEQSQERPPAARTGAGPHKWLLLTSNTGARARPTPALALLAGTFTSGSQLDLCHSETPQEAQEWVAMCCSRWRQEGSRQQEPAGQGAARCEEERLCRAILGAKGHSEDRGTLGDPWGTG